MPVRTDREKPGVNRTTQKVRVVWCVVVRCCDVCGVAVRVVVSCGLLQPSTALHGLLQPPAARTNTLSLLSSTGPRGEGGGLPRGRHAKHHTLVGVWAEFIKHLRRHESARYVKPSYYTLYAPFIHPPCRICTYVHPLYLYIRHTHT